ncbi:DUF1772 domain-containing protein [Ruegeria sediminis]|uniref:DUF1772 domain-containing protein n=1 Tax=Ruegeria sediminis TaxID=2583820 RepID=A0ABY2X5K9_9RHOB|nr:anthrone oxygenase family protein [Ruegeria sediminis]TMV10107.1 DUF1772 domain-containing protein [Ruegeria sediminis]
MARLLVPMSMLSLLSIGAIFGSFYAWVCSTMWGLDATDPRASITAMQAMNASVRNPVFFPSFFLTPVILMLTEFIAIRQERTRSAALFATGAVVYFIGAFLVTVLINVPMNEALATVAVPTDRADAAWIWKDYSALWQVWNTARTLVSGLALILIGLAIHSLKPETT